MMSRVLLWIGALGTLGLVSTAGHGYLRDAAGAGVNWHASVGLVASLLILFSHCWILFFLVGTGKAVKEAVTRAGLSADSIERTKRFKQRLYPWLMLAMALVIATFVNGGWTYGAWKASGGSVWIHRLLAPLTVVIQLWSLYLEFDVLSRNQRLIQRVDREAQAKDG